MWNLASVVLAMSLYHSTIVIIFTRGVHVERLSGQRETFHMLIRLIIY